MSKIKIFSIMTMFFVFVVSANAINITEFDFDDYPNVLDTSRRGLWGSDLVKIHNDTIKFLNVSLSLNGTIRTDLNLSLNSLALASDLVVLGNIYAEIPDSFKNLNWTNLYISEATTRWKIINFTDAYDSRADRFKNLNFTTLINTFMPSFFNNLNFSTQLDLFLPEFYNKENVSNDFPNIGQHITNATIDITESQVSDLVHITNTTIQIGTSQVTNLASFVVANEINPTNSTLLITIGQISDFSPVTNSTILINTGQVTGLATFVVANEQNPSNATIEITESQVSNLVHVSNATIELPSQEKIDGLKSSDSPKFAALNVTDVRILTGAGAPESSVTAPAGSIYLQTNGSFLIKVSGSGNTGWSQVS